MQQKSSDIMFISAIQCWFLTDSIQIVSSCRLRSGLRDGTETSSTFRCRSSARRAVVVSELMWPCGLRSFSILGLRPWNALPRLLHDTSHNTTSFGHSLETFSLSGVQVHPAHQGLWRLCTVQIYIFTRATLC